jgi:hypothetical protein
VIKKIAKDKGGSYEVTFPQSNFVETIDWKDINIDEDQYVLKAFPTSSLSDDLTGRLSDVQELAQAGFISPRTAQRLMGMPDVEMLDTLTSAAENRIHQMLENILDDGDFEPPETNHDLTLAGQLWLQYYNYAQYMGAPVERMNLLLKWKSQLTAVTQVAAVGAAQMQAQAQAAAQPPLANPTATPQSNLLPNQPQAA